MKKNILFNLMVIVLKFTGSTVNAQPLSPNLFSQNGWMTDTVGGGTDPFDTVQCPGLKYGLPCYLAGQLYNRMASLQTSKARYIRFGGTSADQNKPTPRQYRRFVDSVRARGMEPILQIPVNLGEPITGTPAYDTTLAKQIIQAVNDAPYSMNVVYWSIGNEPDEPTPKGYGYDSAHQAVLITKYIKDFSKAMRRAVPSVPIKIIGPELAQWNCDAGSQKKKLVDSLIGYPSLGNRCDITGFDVTGKPWIDIFSFHFYGGIDGNAASLPRATLIDKLRKQYGFAESLDYLKSKLHIADSIQGRLSSPIKMAVTEANIDYQSISNDAFSDVKCNGVFAGQYWLEIASIAAEKGVDFVNFWSSAEGSMGYMKSDGTKKSTYYHFKKAAENFAGTYYTGKDSSNTSPSTGIKNIKAFGTKDANHIAVMILNQDTVNTAYQIYKIRLDNTYATGTGTRIKMNMGIAKEYLDTVWASSTTMLEFDVNGNISQVFRYKQSSGSSSPGFLQPYCSTPVTYATQALLDAYKPGVYSDIIIGGTSAITINSGSTNFNNTIYRAVNSITINGDFTVPLGQSLELITTPCN